MANQSIVRRTEQQQRIIQSARKIIAYKGIESLTVREIAKDLKITDGALYRHFKSKKEIISLLIDDIEETLLTALKEAAASKNDPLQKLENIFSLQLSYSQRVKGTSFVIINQVSGIKDKKLQRKMFGVLNKYVKTIKSILVEGKESGIFRKEINPDSASIIFLGTIQAIVTLWGLSGYRLSLGKAQFAQTLDIYKSWIVK